MLSGLLNLAMSIKAKILFIQTSVDDNLRLILDTKWNSKTLSYRKDIRSFLETQYSFHFSRQQLAQLNDLNWLPEAKDGYISISHCKSLGGFVFSKFKIGFDVEDIDRISLDILKRTSLETELSECPRSEFLWVAKESGFKALSSSYPDTVMTDLICHNWQSHFENQIFSFRLKSEKTLDLGLNKGFIFSEGPSLFSIFLK